jgi:nitroreductase
MEFEELLKKRHCVRKFDPAKKVTDDQINKILEAGRLAPSEGNVQPWYFIVIKNRELKSKLEEARFSSHNLSTFSTASLIIVICIDTKIASSVYKERGLELYSKQSTAVAAEHMFLEVVNRGLDTCWIGAFDEGVVKKDLDLPQNLRPVIIMPIGYPAEDPHTTERKDISEISKIIE